MDEAFRLPAEYEVVSGPFRGGMGCVYCVRHRAWDALLAVKQPRPETLADAEAAARFLTECRNWVALGLHAHVVPCHYVRLQDGVPTVFAEWVDGGSLSEAIRGGQLYEAADPAAVQVRLTDLAIQIARGMAYAHGKGLIHRDLKPGNILLTRSGTAKVTDFGLSVLKGGSDESRGMGTAAYAAPEQQRGGEAAESADLWSFGLLILEMFGGRRSWQSALHAASHLDELLSGCRIPMPQEVQALVRSCCTLRPADRPAGFAAAEQQLLLAYSRLTGQEYPRIDAGETAPAADSLNNRALSHLDLGQAAQAEACWDQALRLQPGHPAASYNRALYRWRRGAADDLETLRILQNVSAGAPGPETAELLVRFLRERCSAAAVQKLCGRYPALRGTDDPDPAEDACRVLVGKRARHICAAGAELLCLFADGTAELWHTETGRRLAAFDLRGLHVHALHLREDGEQIAAACEEGLALFDRKGGRTALLPCADGAVREVHLAADGSALLRAARRDGDVCKQYYLQLALPEGRTLRKLRVTEAEGRLIPLRDGSLLVPAWEELLRVDPAGNVTGLRYAVGGALRCAALSGDETLLAVHAGEETRILRLADGSPVAKLPTGPCTCLAFAREARFLLTGTAGGDLRVWDIAARRCLRTFGGIRGGVACLLPAADGTACFLAGESGGVLCLHIPRFERTAPWKLCRAADPAALQETDRRFRSLLHEAEALHRSGERDKALNCLCAARELSGYARHADYLRLNAVIGRGLPVRGLRAVWLCEQPPAGEFPPGDAAEAPLLRGALSAAARSADGLMAEGGFDGSLCLRSARGKALWTANTGGQITCLRFDHAGFLLAAGQASGSLCLYSREDGRRLRLLPGGRAPVTGLCFTPDDRLLRAEAEDGSVRFWQLDYEYMLPKEDGL